MATRILASAVFGAIALLVPVARPDDRAENRETTCVTPVRSSIDASLGASQDKGEEQKSTDETGSKKKQGCFARGLTWQSKCKPINRIGSRLWQLHRGG